MSKVLSVTISFLLIPLAYSVYADDKKELGYQGQSKEKSNKVLVLLNELRGNPDIEILDYNGWTIAQSKKDFLQYSFAPNTHPAYPAVAKRSPVEKDGSIYLRTQVICGAEKKVCDHFVKEFTLLNQKIKDELNSNSDERPE